MTEEEWLISEDPLLMLTHLCPKSERAEAAVANVTDRKLRLFGVECCRLIWDEMWKGCHPGVEAAERYAEGLAGPEALHIARLACLGATSASEAARLAADWVIAGDWAPLDLKDPRQKLLAAQEVILLHEIFGNPFRPVAFNSAWRTSDVLALARGVYDERAFDRMPILADALQDAGCDSDDILNHCREGNSLSGKPTGGSSESPSYLHVRGCWVLDLILEEM